MKKAMVFSAVFGFVVVGVVFCGGEMEAGGRYNVEAFNAFLQENDVSGKVIDGELYVAGFASNEAEYAFQVATLMEGILRYSNETGIEPGEIGYESIFYLANSTQRFESATDIDFALQIPESAISSYFDAGTGITQRKVDVVESVLSAGNQIDPSMLPINADTIIHELNSAATPQQR